MYKYFTENDRFTVYVGNDGSVKRVNKRTGRNYVVYGTKGNDGYMSVLINHKSYKVHRIVAQMFIPNLEGKPEVNHIDEDKSNNDVSNLNWMTAKENSNWGTRKEKISRHFKNGPTSKKIGRYDLTTDELLEVYPSISETKRQGYNSANIAKVLKGTRNKCGGFFWKYI